MTFPKELLQAMELYKKVADTNLPAEERENARWECRALLDWLSAEMFTEKDKLQ